MSGRGRQLIAAGAVALCVVGVGCADSVERATAPDSETSSTAQAPSAPAVSRYRSPRRYEAVARPIRIRIPSAHVDAPIDPLGLARDGTIAVPKDPDVAGWFGGGPRPGQPGPAVLLGHVDSRKGPAVFFELEELGKGDLVYVDRADRTTATFRVTHSLQTSKTTFPTDDVYAPTLEPSLRLVTCGGSFDRSSGHYRDNVIVFAAPA